MPDVPAKPRTPLPAPGTAAVDGTRASLDAIREELRTEPAEIRPWVATNLAAMLLAVGRDEEADSVLADARRQAALARDPLLVARVEVALAMAAEVRDDDARANEHLALAARDGLVADTSFHAWTITSRLARRQGTTRPDFRGDPDAGAEARLRHSVGSLLVAEVAIERATAARLRGDVVLAGELLESAARRVTKTGSPRLLAMLEEEEGLYAFATLDLGARRRVRRAVELFAEHGLARHEGRALLELAALIARHPEQMRGDSASTTLGRAQTVLGSRATWRDRLTIQNGFRDGGRRVIDRALTDGTVSRIEAFERARGNLLSTVAAAAASADRALTDVELELDDGPTRTRTLARVGKARGVAGENQARTGASLSELDGAVRGPPHRPVRGGARRARPPTGPPARVLRARPGRRSRLVPTPSGAPRRAPARRRPDHRRTNRDGELIYLSRRRPFGGRPDRMEDRGSQGGPRRAWPTRDAGAGDGGSARAGQLAGPVFAVSLRRSGVQGVLYADKLRRRGQFREQDLAVAHLLADYAALSLGKLRARADEHLVRHQLAVTLDAIRDGVLAWDGRGVVTHVNAAAARMLQLGAADLVGKARKDLPTLTPLFALASSPARVEGFGRPARRATSFVVTCAPHQRDFQKARASVRLDPRRARPRPEARATPLGHARPLQLVRTSSARAHVHAAITAVKRAAAIDATVLITGESGTGKEVAAQAIHSSGLRAHGPFVGINCAALPRELLEAELFGYEKGAFTGARADGHRGQVRGSRPRGTILLDESATCRRHASQAACASFRGAR